MEKKLLDEINSRNKDGKMELHKDAGFAENPMDREDIIENIGVEQVKSFSSILAGLKETTFPGLTMVQVPFR